MRLIKQQSINRLSRAKIIKQQINNKTTLFFYLNYINAPIIQIYYQNSGIPTNKKHKDLGQWILLVSQLVLFSQSSGPNKPYQDIDENL